MPTILIVEDEAKMRRLLELDLGEDGFETVSAADAETGLDFLRHEQVDLVLTDLKLPGMSGLEFLQAAKRMQCRAAGDRHDRLRHRRNRRRSHEGRRQRLRPEAVFAGRNAHGGAEGTRRPPPARGKPLAARSPGPALRLSQHRGPQRQDAGGAGAGGARRADAFHRLARRRKRRRQGPDRARRFTRRSSRAAGPFIKINSTAIPENLLESELFGYEKGAFTGAVDQQAGKIRAGRQGHAVPRRNRRRARRPRR